MSGVFFYMFFDPQNTKRLKSMKHGLQNREIADDYCFRGCFAGVW